MNLRIFSVILTSLITAKALVTYRSVVVNVMAQEGENMACATAAEMQDWLQARYGSRFAEANADKATHAGESALSRRRRRHQASEGNGTVLRRINGSRPLRHNLALQEETWLKVLYLPASRPGRDAFHAGAPISSERFHRFHYAVVMDLRWLLCRVPRVFSHAGTMAPGRQGA